MNKERLQDNYNEEEHLQIIPLEMLSGMGSQEQNTLESKGILFIEEMITRQSLTRAMKRLVALSYDTNFKDEIKIIINSPGGYCDAGWAFIDLMSNCPHPIRTIALGEVCSMASSIFIAGDYRVMGPNCSTMIHQFNGSAEGSHGDLLASQRGWEIEMDKQIKHLIKHSKYKNVAQVKKQLLKDHDHWMSPKEMINHGLCDKVFSSRKRKVWKA